MKLCWLTLFPILLLTSCSRYSSDYKKAASKFQQGKTPAGPWEGTWKSNHNGHTGPLWCLVSPDKDPNFWNFRYRAGWGALKFGDYVHRVETKLGPDGTLPMDASMTLPANFGTYAVKGTLTPTKFDLRFKGNGDHGTMTLTRPSK